MSAGRRRLMFAKAEEPVDYLKLTALESGTFTLSIGSSVTVANFEYVEYSIDDGATWTRTDNVASATVTITTPTIAAGNSVLWRGSGVRIGSTSTSNTAANNSIFSSTGQCNVSGDIRTLLGLNKPNNLTISTYIYKFLFLNMSKLKDASELIMPSTTNTNCFYGMFVSCTGLTKPPSLPATNVAGSAYRLMFSGCTSLTSVPALPAETLGTYCYTSMFIACSSLVTAQTTLPATTLNSYCYSGMFSDCTSLTSVPSLPATTLNDYCYSEMFRGCTSLTTPPALTATTLANYCYEKMFYGCTSLINPPTIGATETSDNCFREMFYGCNKLTTPPTIPLTNYSLSQYSFYYTFYGCTSLTSTACINFSSITALANYALFGIFRGCTALTTTPTSLGTSTTTLGTYCYNNMFYGCTKITTAPELPATTLVSSCYGALFRNCTLLNYVKALFTTTPSSSYTSNWLSGVASTGIFVKNINATWTDTGVNAVPTGWTIIYYDPSTDKYYQSDKTTECDDHGNPI